MTKELLAEIADAQMVLVGIGKEMEETYKEMENDSFYSSLMAQARKRRTQLQYCSICNVIIEKRTRIPEK